MKGTNQTREPYLKPQIFRVSLAPDEMAATGCKTRTGLGRSGSCSKTKCLQIGS